MKITRKPTRNVTHWSLRRSFAVSRRSVKGAILLKYGIPWYRTNAFWDWLNRGLKSWTTDTPKPPAQSRAFAYPLRNKSTQGSDTTRNWHDIACAHACVIVTLCKKACPYFYRTSNFLQFESQRSKCVKLGVMGSWSNLELFQIKRFVWK